MGSPRFVQRFARWILGVSEFPLGTVVLPLSQNDVLVVAMPGVHLSGRQREDLLGAWKQSIPDRRVLICDGFDPEFYVLQGALNARGEARPASGIVGGPRPPAMAT